MSGILIGLLILLATLILGNFLRQYEPFGTFSPLWDPNCIEPGMYCPYCPKGDCPFLREGKCKYLAVRNSN
jgi:hypothetical protein